MQTVRDVWTLDRPAVFGPAKDRPVLFTAAAWADVLLTLDRADFGSLIGTRFYGLQGFDAGPVSGAGARRGAIALNRLQKFADFREAGFGFALRKAREAAADLNVIAVAREHQFVLARFDGGDVFARGENL